MPAVGDGEEPTWDTAQEQPGEEDGAPAAGSVRDDCRGPETEARDAEHRTGIGYPASRTGVEENER